MFLFFSPEESIVEKTFSSGSSSKATYMLYSFSFGISNSREIVKEQLSCLKD
ncbi:hypothetical protein [Methanobrevibacter sp.]